MIATLATLLVSSLAFAQHDAGEQKKKPLSPPAKAEATLNGKVVTIDYSAPSKRERVIMGGLVPYGKVWRTGANAATTLTTATDLNIGTLQVPAGTYTLYTIPNEKDWTLIVNTQNGQWGTEYDESKDFGRTQMTVRTLKSPVETFVIGIKNGKLTLTWENTEASVPLTAR